MPTKEPIPAIAQEPEKVLDGQPKVRVVTMVHFTIRQVATVVA